MALLKALVESKDHIHLNNYYQNNSVDAILQSSYSLLYRLIYQAKTEIMAQLFLSLENIANCTDSG